jgi:septum site-determining protein MinD
MPGYVCTVAGGKGGVGKTTTAVNLGTTLQARSFDTVVVDADLGVANLGRVMDVDYAHRLHEVLAGEARVEAALTRAGEGMTVLPGEVSLEAFADADPAGLREVIEALRERFEVVSDDVEAAGDEPLVVTAPESDAADAYSRITSQLERVVSNGTDPDELDQIDDDFSGGPGLTGLRTG